MSSVAPLGKITFRSSRSKMSCASGSSATSSKPTLNMVSRWRRQSVLRPSHAPSPVSSSQFPIKIPSANSYFNASKSHFNVKKKSLAFLRGFQLITHSQTKNLFLFVFHFFKIHISYFAVFFLFCMRLTSLRISVCTCALRCIVHILRSSLPCII